MQEIGKVDVKVIIIPKELEKYIAFMINKNVVSVYIMQFMNSSLDKKIVKNWSEIDFTYLHEEFSGNLLELAKQKGIYTFEYTDSFKKWLDKKLPDKCIFF